MQHILFKLKFVWFLSGSNVILLFSMIQQKKKGGKPAPVGKSPKTSPKRGGTLSAPSLVTRAKSPIGTFTIDDVVDG